MVLRTFLRVCATLCVVAVAAGLMWVLWDYYMVSPWTRDGLIHADVVQVAPDVSGPVKEIFVHENQSVEEGDPLFKIDPARFEMALREAEAELADRKAAYDKEAGVLARDTQLDQTAISPETRDNQTYATEEAKAAYEQAQAQRDLAAYNLERTLVRAPVSGRIANFSLRPGSYLQEGQGVFPLVVTGSLAVYGFFEETKISRVPVGAPVRVTLMDGSTFPGTVQGISPAISGNVFADNRLLPNINPVFTWVRLARRVPARIALKDPTDPRLIAGMTASVEVLANQAP